MGCTTEFSLTATRLEARGHRILRSLVGQKGGEPHKLWSDPMWVGAIYRFSYLTATSFAHETGGPWPLHSVISCWSERLRPSQTVKWPHIGGSNPLAMLASTLGPAMTYHDRLKLEFPWSWTLTLNPPWAQSRFVVPKSQVATLISFTKWPTDKVFWQKNWPLHSKISMLVKKVETVTYHEVTPHWWEHFIGYAHQYVWVCHALPWSRKAGVSLVLDPYLKFTLNKNPLCGSRLPSSHLGFIHQMAGRTRFFGQRIDFVDRATKA